MKRASSSQAARELDSITASFVNVRILYYASEAPTTAATLVEQIRGQSRLGKPAHILTSLARNGLLKAKPAPYGQSRRAPQYSLTPAGRRLLATAKKHLRQLAAPPFPHRDSNTKRQ
jgi:DNA-binding MarR family transcriptional regulator